MNAKVVRIALLAAAAGAGLTFVLVERDGPAGRRPERSAADLQRRFTLAQAERDAARAEVAQLRERLDALSGQAPATPQPGSVQVPAIPVDPEARKRRVAQLRSQMKVWLETGNGAAAGAALKELAQMNPEGFTLAAELYMLFHEDLGDDSKLGHTKWVHISPYIEDPGLRDLMSWALEHPDVDMHESFRAMVAWRLPWIQDREVTETQYLHLIQTEKDRGVRHGLVDGLGRDRHGESARGAAGHDHRPTAQARAAPGRGARAGRPGPRVLGARDRRQARRDGAS